jgi:hypothetical protein
MGETWVKRRDSILMEGEMCSMNFNALIARYRMMREGHVER